MSILPYFGLMDIVIYLYIILGSSWLIDDDRDVALDFVMDSLRRTAYPLLVCRSWWIELVVVPTDWAVPPLKRFVGFADYDCSLTISMPIVRAHALMLSKHPWQRVMQPNTGLTRLSLEVNANEWKYIVNKSILSYIIHFAFLFELWLIWNWFLLYIENIFMISFAYRFVSYNIKYILKVLVAVL